MKNLKTLFVKNVFAHEVPLEKNTLRRFLQLKKNTLQYFLQLKKNIVSLHHKNNM